MDNLFNDKDIQYEKHFRNFERFRHVENFAKQEVEYWLARELQELLGYSDWKNFEMVIQKSKESCKNSNQSVLDHFSDVGKMIDLPKGGKRDISDIKLTRYACYLTAMEADSKKEPVLFAKSYFAIATRQLELIKQRLLENKRLLSKEESSASENFLESIVYKHGITEKQDFAKLKSKMDNALLKSPTRKIKEILKIPNNRALTDFTPPIIAQAKGIVNTITGINVENKQLYGIDPISKEGTSRAKDTANFFEEQLGKPLHTFLENAGDIKQIERKIKKLDKTMLVGFPPRISQKVQNIDADRSISQQDFRKEFVTILKWYALYEMYITTDGTVTTKELISNLDKKITIPSYYKKNNPSKNNEPYYYQIVRNLKSNKNNASSLQKMGFAINIKNGFKITEAGKQFVEEVILVKSEDEK